MKIKNIILTAVAIIGLAMLTTPGTQAQTCNGTGANFVDLNGDGFNDNASDHDGDGIPNGLDADYVKNAQDGSGYQKGKLGESQGEGMAQNRTMTKSQKFHRLQAFEGSIFRYRFGALGGMNGSGAGICDGTGGGMAGGSGLGGGNGHNGGRRHGGN
jgi:hypothetical protein